MGGQACVFYGAAEFSRDADLLILSDAENLNRLQAALRELDAECIAVPPLAADYLERGHAVHFRCHHPEAANIRVDFMSTLRGLEPFRILWERRTTITEADGTIYELLSLPDLVMAKKTQRNKDWPMLQRLLEAHYLGNRATSTPQQQEFWLKELRTPALLREAAETWPDLARQLTAKRPLLTFARTGELDALEEKLTLEESAEREQDRNYWQPLKVELEQLRRAARERRQDK